MLSLEIYMVKNKDPGQGVHPPDQLFLIFTGNHLEENRTSPTTTSRLWVIVSVINGKTIPNTDKSMTDKPGLGLDHWSGGVET
jgi:hypothetical protein